ncbi:hypothetical protein Sjap_020544 [Stephania japonica]|uniref:Uncharacterized protein n=1 Tax=Stephania japonica TaxID=461633 RepID=A0AAP0I0I3_9MAGN
MEEKSKKSKLPKKLNHWPPLNNLKSATSLAALSITDCPMLQLELAESTPQKANNSLPFPKPSRSQTPKTLDLDVT